MVWVRNAVVGWPILPWAGQRLAQPYLILDLNVFIIILLKHNTRIYVHSASLKHQKSNIRDSLPLQANAVTGQGPSRLDPSCLTKMTYCLGIAQLFTATHTATSLLVTHGLHKFASMRAHRHRHRPSALGLATGLANVWLSLYLT